MKGCEGILDSFGITFRSPVKSRQRPQKRHFIFEDDDNDRDFQASPSARRKLDNWFGDTTKTR